MSKLSILGLYQYDQSLFDNLNFPADFTANDRETLINNLLMDCAEFECVYPNFDFCKAAIGWWSKSRLQVWQKLYNSTMFVYNPIWNKDGTITETRSKEYSDEKSGTVESSKEYSDEKSGTAENFKEYSGEKLDAINGLKEIESEKSDAVATSKLSSGNQDVETENKTAGFNSSGYVNKDKQTSNLDWDETVTGTERHTITESSSVTDTTNTSETTTGTESGSSTESGTTSGNESGSTTESGTTAGTESEEYVRTEQGNIGVTSTQQLIKEEREIALFEIDDFIINDFKRQFCILVY